MLLLCNDMCLYTGALPAPIAYITQLADKAALIFVYTSYVWHDYKHNMYHVYSCVNLDSKVHGANMGSIWGR